MFQLKQMNWIDLFNTTGVVVLITTLSNGIAKAIERKSRYKKAILQIGEIYDVFNHVIDDSCADRILILKGSNGGSRPTIGSNLYVSVLHEASTKGVGQIKSQYQQIHVDDSYIRLLQSIIEKNEVSLSIDTLPEDSFLRLTYEKEQLMHSYLFEIKGDGDNYYFGSFSTQNPQGFTSEDKLAFRLAIDRLRKIYKNEK